MRALVGWLVGRVYVCIYMGREREVCEVKGVKVGIYLHYSCTFLRGGG